MKNGKIFIFSFIALFLLAVAILTLSACDTKTLSQEEITESCIRIHIRANSNGQADQSVKLAVRDKITAYLTSALENCKTKSEAQSTLARSQSTLISIANSTLAANGFNYNSSIRIGKEYFPDRVYDGYDFPAGTYDAMIINLGSGEGDNWWCVAFPPLCFVPDGGNGEKVVYKSWIKEMLDKIFG